MREVKPSPLKTVGLLQLMLPIRYVDGSRKDQKHFLFDRILTDIGKDNQSIENHLSTYSY
jgi:dsDNA-specific endonuclease/ATPase MutS2